MSFTKSSSSSKAFAHGAASVASTHHHHHHHHHHCHYDNHRSLTKQGRGKRRQSGPNIIRPAKPRQMPQFNPASGISLDVCPSDGGKDASLVPQRQYHTCQLLREQPYRLLTPKEPLGTSPWIFMLGRHCQRMRATEGLVRYHKSLIDKACTLSWCSAGSRAKSTRETTHKGITRYCNFFSSITSVPNLSGGGWLRSFVKGALAHLLF